MAERIPTMYGRYYTINLVWRGREFTPCPLLLQSYKNSKELEHNVLQKRSILDLE